MSMWRFEDAARFDMPVVVVAEINDEVLTPEMGALINGFWIDADARLAEADEDPRRAALIMVGLRLIGLAIEHDGNPYLIQRSFEGSEGFPPGLLKAVREANGIVDLEYHELAITELTS